MRQRSVALGFLLVIGVTVLLLHVSVPRALFAADRSILYEAASGRRATPRPMTFRQSMRRVQDAMHESIYVFNRSVSLPLMKVTADTALRTAEARSWLRSQRLVVAAIVRNALPSLEASVRILRRLSHLFLSVTAVFVENDSADETRAYLHGLSQLSTPSFRVFLLGCGTVDSPDPCHADILYRSSGRRHEPGFEEQVKRTAAEESVDRGLVMAAIRNIGLQFIYDRVEADLLLVLESDLLWVPWRMESVAQGLFHFKAHPALDSLCAVTVGGNNRMHDPCTLVFFHNRHFYVSADETQSPFVRRYGGGSQLYMKHLNIPNAAPRDVPATPVKVASCFQGAAFYRLSSLRDASIFYKYSEGEWNCEHATLSKQLSENYLDTQMVLNIVGQLTG